MTPPEPRDPPDVPTTAIAEALREATAGEWSYLAAGEKSNEWSLGVWQYEDGETVPAGTEVGDCDTERYLAQGEPADFEGAMCVEPVCENPSSSARLADAHLIANAPTWLAQLLAALEVERTAHAETMRLMIAATTMPTDRMGMDMIRELCADLEDDE